MAQGLLPENYVGREQAYVKHRILETYIERLFMIVGQNKAVVNYVDCFSGPWQEGDKLLSDTSIGISLNQMSRCHETLKTRFKRDVRFRALYIEKDSARYAKLQTFLSRSPYAGIEVECIKGDYAENLREIVEWCAGQFTFFFVDPKGWDAVGIQALKPLLELENSEFLINLMYDFINRFVTLEDQAGNMTDIFGEVPQLTNLAPDERQSTLLGLFRRNLNTNYNGRTAYVPIQKPGKNRVHYYLVYLTRNAKGLGVFKEEAEKMDITQRGTQQEIKLREQLQRGGTQDMFGTGSDMQLQASELEDNRYAAKQRLLQLLADGVVRIDNDLWADLLEETDLFPSDFQIAMKELVKDGLAINLDADAGRRPKKPIKPDWPQKSERWKIVES